jgi:hypothetical protein
MTIHVQLDGARLSLRQLAKKFGCAYDTVYGRYRRGQRDITLLTRPPDLSYVERFRGRSFSARTRA